MRDVWIVVAPEKKPSVATMKRLPRRVICWPRNATVEMHTNVEHSTQSMRPLFIAGWVGASNIVDAAMRETTNAWYVPIVMTTPGAAAAAKMHFS